MSESVKTPATVLMVILLLALVEPLTHFWILAAPPAGMVPTGVHTGDSAHHLIAMEAFSSGGYSPYVSCEAESGANSLSYFAAPIFLLYAILGEITGMLGLVPFIALGFINGLAGALYLWCVWRLFRLVLPVFAETAFYLFALGGGAGGVLYLMALALGRDQAPLFQESFLRFAAYDLIEGQHGSPLLLMPRAYYTLPMAMGVASLTAFIESERMGCRAHLFFSGFLLFFCTLINIRIGPVIWGVGLLYVGIVSGETLRERATLIASYGLYCFSGGVLFYAILLNHPSYSGNVYSVGQQIMGLIPFLSATLFLWPPLLHTLYRIVFAAPPLLRGCIGAGLGYFHAYLILYFGYQAYWGNLLYGGDVKAGTVVSDWALIGAVLGVLLTLRPLRKRPFKTNPVYTWLACWFFVLLCVSLSAWGQGWTIRFSPQRFMLLMPLPMALLAACGLATLPRVMSKLCYGLTISLGVISLGVGCLFFQGHAGEQGPEQPFAYLHYAHMNEGDATALVGMDPGYVMTPPWSPIAFGEILAQHGGLRIVGGPGAMNLGDLPFSEIQGDVAVFWNPATADAVRRDITERRCLDWVYCSATAPASPEMISVLRSTPWLKIHHEAGGVLVFRVES